MIKNFLFSLGIFSFILSSGCSTSTVLKGGIKTYTNTKRINLVDDQVIAFGKPTQTDQNISQNDVVIVGEKNSYVLTFGGAQFVQLIHRLDVKNIQIIKDLAFYSEKNDGNFTGILPITYVKLKDEISREDKEFFIQNAAEECTTSSDTRMNAQRFCFNIRLKGVVYPPVNNLKSLQPLSKPYLVNIYTNEKTTYTQSGNALEKLVVLPFAVAFDVISFPFKAADKIFN